MCELIGKQEVELRQGCCNRRAACRRLPRPASVTVVLAAWSVLRPVSTMLPGRKGDVWGAWAVLSSCSWLHGQMKDGHGMTAICAFIGLCIWKSTPMGQACNALLLARG